MYSMNPPTQRGIYQMVNSLSKKPSIQCLITLGLYLLVISLHLIYIFTPIISGKITQNPILYVMLGLHFLLLIMILYDYIWLLVHDPVDRLVYDPQLVPEIDIKYLEECDVCGSRYKGSHHCGQCNRCTQEFDHHCKFLNNCIGSRNYQQFFRLLSVNLLFLANVIGQGVWVFFRVLYDKSLRSVIPPSFWVIVGVMGLCFGLFVAIVILIIFHCYLNCSLGMTTIDYLIGRLSQDKNKNKQQKVETERIFT